MRRKHAKIGVYGCLLVFGMISTVRAQDIEEVLNSKFLEVSGASVSLSQGFYSSFDTPSDRNGFAFYASGNVGLSIFGLSAPLSFSYTNRKVSYTRPFNQFSFAPRYKWVALRLGGQSQSYSPYTLSGHSFNGASVELTPGNFTAKLSAGKFLKAQTPDSVETALPYVYERLGLGGLFEYRHESDKIGITFFTAKDNINSIPPTPDNHETRPQQNLAISASATKKLVDRLLLETEIATSFLNEDISSPEQKEISDKRLYAYKAALNYTANKYNLNLSFEHVDPEYITLGGYYFNNDLEKIVLGASTVLMKGRLNLNMQVGQETNNLRDTETNTTKRWVGAVNTTFQASQKLLLAVNYSNFSAYTQIRPAIETQYRDELDTLNFYQVNQTATGMASWSIGNNRRPRTLSVNASLQSTGQTGYGQENTPPSDYYNTAVIYAVSFPDKDLNISSSINSYLRSFGDEQTRSVGPSASLSKSFMARQLRSTWSVASTINQEGAERTSKTYSLRWNLSFQSKVKREENKREKTNTRKTVSKRKFTTKTRQAGYQKEYSATTGLELPEALSLTNQKVSREKVKNEEKKKVERLKKAITEHHRFGANVVYNYRDTPYGERKIFKDFMVRLNYVYTF